MFTLVKVDQTEDLRDLQLDWLLRTYDITDLTGLFFVVDDVPVSRQQLPAEVKRVKATVGSIINGRVYPTTVHGYAWDGKLFISERQFAKLT